ncbi:MAG TPA: SelB C-terminal domain-containing protein, partial [Terriglobales bacterium]|nr:SelB C-terminal domain-containing protein [Terriglobales bacterium]
VFTMKGFGTVVTGTLISGTIRRDEELEIFPGGNRARVRGVQVHGESADAAIVGQRTALNLSGIDKDELKRGMVLAPPSTFNVTSGVDVTLSLLPSAKILKDRARVHLHVYAAETVAKIALYGSKTLAAGGTSYAHLKLAEPALLLPGDRFIIRQFSPVVTIGGGVVLDACPLPRGVPFRKLLESGTPREILLSRIHHRMLEGLSLGHAVAATGWRKEFIESQLSGDLKQGNVVRIGDVLFGPVALSVLKTGIEDRVADFHKHNPLSPGISREVLREKLQVGPELFGLAVEQLVKDTKIQATGDQIYAVGHGVVMKDDEAESKKTIESAFATAGLKVPALKDVLAELKVDKARAHKIVTLLLRDKTLVKIADDLVFHREALENLRGTIAKYKAKSLKINVAQFKELTGVSRKYAIPLLEFLDRERITRRVGDERLIL